MMKWLIDNWTLLVVLLVLVIFAINLGHKCATMDKETNIKNIKEWLKFAVTEAEKSLGEKTGAMKLRMVYDMAVNKFPWIVELVSFETFSTWVDEALLWMKTQLESNKAINDYVNRGE